MSTMWDIENWGLEERNKLFSAVSKMFNTTFLNVCALCADRKSNNAAASTFLPVILAHEMYALRAKELYDVVKMHRERLRMTHTAACLLKIGAAFRAFKKHVESSQEAMNTVIMFGKCTVKASNLFAKSWAPFAKMLRLLTAILR